MSIIKNIYIRKEAANDTSTHEIIARFPNITPVIIEDESEIELKFEDSNDYFKKIKENLIIKHNKGHFVARCPGSSGVTCCNYYVINLVEGCLYDCKYCILQSYLNSKGTSVFTNLNKLKEELEALAYEKRDSFFRIGPGELADSLVLDHITNHSTYLINLFKEFKNGILELKTKSMNIENILKYAPQENVVIAWSVNPQFIVRRIETGTPSIDKRLAAMERVLERGYKIAIHFDPLFYYPNWQLDYFDLIDRLMTIIQKYGIERISWISLGTVRFNKKLLSIVKERFATEPLFIEEFFPSVDNKLRYFRFVREDMYRAITNRLKEKNKDLPLYFCMEPAFMWENIKLEKKELLFAATSLV